MPQLAQDAPNREAAGVEDRPHWRRHKDACPFYRENWIATDQPMLDEAGDTVLYEIYCLKDTPPVTIQEQDKCFRSRRLCWRLHQKNSA